MPPPHDDPHPFADEPHPFAPRTDRVRAPGPAADDAPPRLSPEHAAELKRRLLDDLTPPQREAVEHVDGPILVLAGPGSGKTRVITRRVVNLVLRHGIAPWHVLAITFTNKAAGEMRDRVAKQVTPRQARAMTLSTFHSLCARLLREHAARLDLPPGYSIYDTSDQNRAMKQTLEDLEINPKNFPPQQMLSSISNAKNDLLDAAAYSSAAADFYTRTVAKVYKRYEQVLTRNNALDFDDLLLKTVQLLRDHRDVLDLLRDRFRYVMIDEYQDTNHAQFVLANALAAEHKNLMATGDPDQSIYGWRGANIRNILDFETHYPNAKIVRLEQNYRSTKSILAAADALIQQNTARHHKSLWTDNPDGTRVACVTVRDERHEAEYLVEQFQYLHDKESLDWGEMAIFYRMNSLSRVVEDALRNATIPYQIARGTSFYDRKEIKDAVAYLRTIANPADEVNLLRVVNTPTRGIGDKSIKAVQAYAMTHNEPADRVIADPMGVTALSSRAQNAMAKFAAQLASWRAMAGLEQGRHVEPGLPGGLPGVVEPPTLAGFVETVIRESGLETYYANDKGDPDSERLANLGELVSSAAQHEEEAHADRSLSGEPPLSLSELLLSFLEGVSLVSDVDAVGSEGGQVTLMTLHAAKGLEFSAVAMVGLEDGLLPHSRALASDSEMQEERRLCFVGITRAMHRLYLTHARRRTVFGQTQAAIASRFLQELPDASIECDDLSEETDGFDDGYGDYQRSRAQDRQSEYPEGTLVRHPQFGLGKVLNTTASGAQTRARIDFPDAGKKTLVLQYARLEKVAG